jgi:hypothetical protein
MTNFFAFPEGAQEEAKNIDVGEYRFTQSMNGRVWMEHKSGEGFEITSELAAHLQG